jgi:hypothetical protein
VWQANVSIGVRTFGRPALIAIVNTAATIGVVGVAARLALGDTAAALAVTAVLGGGLYLVGLARVRTPLHLDTWWNGLRGERRPA